MDKKTLFLIGSTILATLTAGNTYADKRNYFTDYARVVHVEPIYKFVTIYKPHRECELVIRGNRQARSDRGRHNNGPVFTSGVIRGSIGQQVTRSQIRPQRQNRNSTYQHLHNSNSGHNNNRGRNHNNRRVERCTTTTVAHKERHLDGYNVTYHYNGHTFYTRTNNDPGRRIQIRVQIKPH